MKSYAYYNGEYNEPSLIRVPLSDRAIYFADAVYEVMIGKGGKVYQSGEHLLRLRGNAEGIGLRFPGGIENVIHEVINKSGCDSYTVYVQLSATGEDRLHAGRVAADANLLVVVSEASFDGKCGEISAITREDVRYRMCDRKTTNLLPAVLASIAARESDCEEAILIRDGIVTEGAKSNLFLLFGSLLLTHPLDTDVLPGITRSNIVKRASELGLKVCEQKFSAKLLYEADEVFISSTTKFIRRVRKIDGVDCRALASDIINKLYSALYDDFVIINC